MFSSIVSIFNRSDRVRDDGESRQHSATQRTQKSPSTTHIDRLAENAAWNPQIAFQTNLQTLEVYCVKNSAVNKGFHENRLVCETKSQKLWVELACLNLHYNLLNDSSCGHVDLSDAQFRVVRTCREVMRALSLMECVITGFESGVITGFESVDHSTSNKLEARKAVSEAAISLKELMLTDGFPGFASLSEVIEKVGKEQHASFSEDLNVIERMVKAFYLADPVSKLGSINSNRSGVSEFNDQFTI